MKKYLYILIFVCSCQNYNIKQAINNENNSVNNNAINNSIITCNTEFKLNTPQIISLTQMLGGLGLILWSDQYGAIIGNGLISSGAFSMTYNNDENNLIKYFKKCREGFLIGGASSACIWLTTYLTKSGIFAGLINILFLNGIKKEILNDKKKTSEIINKSKIPSDMAALGIASIAGDQLGIYLAKDLNFTYNSQLPRKLGYIFGGIIGASSSLALEFLINRDEFYTKNNKVNLQKVSDKFFNKLILAGPIGDKFTKLSYDKNKAKSFFDQLNNLYNSWEGTLTNFLIFAFFGVELHIIFFLLIFVLAVLIIFPLCISSLMD